MRSWSSYHQSPSDDHQEYDVHGNLIVAEAGDFEAEPSTAGALATAQANPKSQAVTGRIFGRKKKGLEFYKVFHLIMMFYLYLYCSRIPELVPSLHIGAALQPILLIGMFMTGTTKSLFKSDIGKTMFYFMLWVGSVCPLQRVEGRQLYDLAYDGPSARAVVFHVSVYTKDRRLLSSDVHGGAGHGDHRRRNLGHGQRYRRQRFAVAPGPWFRCGHAVGRKLPGAVLGCRHTVHHFRHVVEARASYVSRCFSCWCRFWRALPVRDRAWECWRWV